MALSCKRITAKKCTRRILKMAKNGGKPPFSTVKGLVADEGEDCRSITVVFTVVNLLVNVTRKCHFHSHQPKIK